MREKTYKVMHLDSQTFEIVKRKFEGLYGSLGVGLSKSAWRKLRRHKIIPKRITSNDESEELLHIASEYNKILNEVMKPHNEKSRASQEPKNYRVFS